MWPSRLRPESQRRGAPPRRTFRKNSQQSGSSDSCNFCAVARFFKTANLIWPWHSAMAPQKFAGIPGTNRAPEIPEIRCDRILSLTSGYLKTSQNPWTLARNFMPRYSSFSANFIQPTGAFYLRDSHVFLNRRNRCHINFFANYLSFRPIGRWPLAPLRPAEKGNLQKS